MEGGSRCGKDSITLRRLPAIISLAAVTIAKHEHGPSWPFVIGFFRPAGGKNSVVASVNLITISALYHEELSSAEDLLLPIAF
jgi:hypothetical protein